MRKAGVILGIIATVIGVVIGGVFIFTGKGIGKCAKNIFTKKSKINFYQEEE